MVYHFHFSHSILEKNVDFFTCTHDFVYTISILYKADPRKRMIIVAAGWELGHGELTKNNIDFDTLWNRFNFVFSDSCRKTSTYKFGFIKAILDNLLSAAPTSLGMEISFDDLFSKFAENYWNLITKYHLKQLRINTPNPDMAVSKLEQTFMAITNREPHAANIEFENLASVDKTAIIQQIKRDCSKFVIGALYNDFNGELYGFDKKAARIWIHYGAYQFLWAHKQEIERLNYYAWAKFLERINNDSVSIKLLDKLEAATPRRQNLAPYREILRNEFETDTCFYCGKKLHKTPHIDHVIPWSFIKSDHLWNFVLACPKCNIKKKDQLPTRQKLAVVVSRNESLSHSKDSIISLEFKGYNENLLWQLWDYGYKRGLHVFQP